MTTWPPANIAAIRAYQQTRLALYRTGEAADSTTIGQVVKERSLGWGAVRTKETHLLPGNGTSDSNSTVLPLPAAIASAMSRLLFGETLGLTGDDASLDRLRLILDTAKWDTRLSEAGEIASAAGDVYLLAAWDAGDRLMAIPTIVHPDRVVPVFKWGRLAEGTAIETEYRVGRDTYVHLERHYRGRINHTLHKRKDDGTLGTPAPFETIDALAGIAKAVDEAGDIETGTDRLLIVHVPNAVPNRRFAGDPVGAHLGRSDFDCMDDAFAAVVENDGSLRRDTRHGQSRILADADALEPGKPGEGGAINLDREVFVGLAAGADADAKRILEAIQFNIRVTEHREVRRYWLDAIMLSLGIGPSALGIADAAMGLTATEIASRDQATRNTREERTRLWTPALSEFYTTLLELDRAAFAGPGAGDGVGVVFPPAAVPTIMEVAGEIQALMLAQAITIRTAIKKANPDWNDEQIDEEYALKMAEDGRLVPDLGLIPE